MCLRNVATAGARRLASIVRQVKGGQRQVGVMDTFAKTFKFTFHILLYGFETEHFFVCVTGI